MNALIGSKSLIVDEEKTGTCKFRRNARSGVVTAPDLEKMLFIRPYFDCYQSLPLHLELTLPEATALVSQRKKLLALVRSDLVAGLDPDTQITSLGTQRAIVADRLSFFLLAASSSRGGDWLQVEQILAYHRMWQCHESGTLVYNAFHGSKPVTIGNVTHNEEPSSVACLLCPGHPLSKHMPSFDKHSLVQDSNGSVMCLDSFILREVYDLLRFVNAKADPRL